MVEAPLTLRDAPLPVSGQSRRSCERPGAGRFNRGRGDQPRGLARRQKPATNELRHGTSFRLADSGRDRLRCYSIRSCWPCILPSRAYGHTAGKKKTSAEFSRCRPASLTAALDARRFCRRSRPQKTSAEFFRHDRNAHPNVRANKQRKPTASPRRRLCLIDRSSVPYAGTFSVSRVLRSHVTPNACSAAFRWAGPPTLRMSAPVAGAWRNVCPRADGGSARPD